MEPDPLMNLTTSELLRNIEVVSEEVIASFSEDQEFVITETKPVSNEVNEEED